MQFASMCCLYQLIHLCAPDKIWELTLEYLHPHNKQNTILWNSSDLMMLSPVVCQKYCQDNWNFWTSTNLPIYIIFFIYQKILICFWSDYVHLFYFLFFLQIIQQSPLLFFYQGLVHQYILDLLFMLYIYKKF